jgi:transcriptional regulator with XRE-family HTH domain
MDRKQEPGRQPGPRGERVREARRRRGLTLEVVAGLIGKSKAWLSMIENGRLPLEKLADIAALAVILHVPVADLSGAPVPAVPAEPDQARRLAEFGKLNPGVDIAPAVLWRAVLPGPDKEVVVCRRSLRELLDVLGAARGTTAGSGTGADREGGFHEG